ncbi:MAG: NAD(P) transhydrogenase subunit alpha [Chloroflexi bacterium]|nr:MAG: NAD(P) transhydrogenase subunit alpha [Chloroflexota bacterium]
MSAHLLAEITVLVLAAFVGFEVISKVPTTLHTPLMSGTNAIHGIVIVGGMLVAGSSHDWIGIVLGTIAVTFGTINVVGGFLVTDRMLGTNAIHGIVIVGGMLVAGSSHDWIGIVLGTIAVTFGTINVVGGFLVTDRMLEMFKGRRPAPSDEQKAVP